MDINPTWRKTTLDLGILVIICSCLPGVSFVDSFSNGSIIAFKLVKTLH